MFFTPPQLLSKMDNPIAEIVKKRKLDKYEIEACGLLMCSTHYLNSSSDLIGEIQKITGDIQLDGSKEVTDLHFQVATNIRKSICAIDQFDSLNKSNQQNSSGVIWNDDFIPVCNRIKYIHSQIDMFRPLVGCIFSDTKEDIADIESSVAFSTSAFCTIVEIINNYYIIRILEGDNKSYHIDEIIKLCKRVVELCKSFKMYNEIEKQNKELINLVTLANAMCTSRINIING